MNNPKPGELWLVRSHDGHSQAVVCVLTAGPSVVSVAFTDNETDLCYSEELRFDAGEAAPWPVRLSMDLIGPIPRQAFTERVGQLPVPLDDLEDASWGDWPASLARRRGSPLSGPSDPRWRDAERRADGLEVFLAQGVAD